MITTSKLPQSPASTLMKQLEELYTKAGMQMPKKVFSQGSFLITSHKPNKPIILSKEDIPQEQLSEERKRYRDLLDQKNEAESEEVNELSNTQYSLETWQEMYREHEKKTRHLANSKKDS